MPPRSPASVLRPLCGVLVAFVLAALALPGAAAAQVVPADSARPPADTLSPATLPAGDTAAADSAVRRLSPRGAFLRSLVLPGWGQSELGSPGRGSVYFALEVGSLWMVYKSDRKLQEARERQRWLRETGQLAPGQRSGLVRDREAQREDWITLAVFWLFFSGADAFVAAHLQDFDARVGVLPTPDGGVQLRATVPVGNRR